MLYDWECTACGYKREVVSTIARRNDPEFHECKYGTGEPVALTRLITAPMVNPDIKPYRALTGDKAGQEIGSRRAHREFLKRNRLVEIGNEPMRPTKEFRKVHRRGEIARALKDSIAQHCAPDLKRGGLIERNR
jgi:hypothetical protein